MSVPKNDLSAALAATRKALQTSLSANNEQTLCWRELEWATKALLDAIDAAQPVGSVQTITSLVGETRKFIACAVEEIDALPVGTAVYAAPRDPPDLVTQLDHARRRIGQLTIQLGEVMKAPPAQPLVERYGDCVLVHWPEGVVPYVQVGDCVTGYLARPTQPVAVDTHGDEFGRGWNACRKAMLKAHPAPAAVPEGYVPVSMLVEAREQVESWGAYAAPYFTDKWDLAGTLAKMDAQIAAALAAKGES